MIKDKEPEKLICPKCQHDRWKTHIKGVSYTCRRCGFTGNVKEK